MLNFVYALFMAPKNLKQLIKKKDFTTFLYSQLSSG